MSEHTYYAAITRDASTRDPSDRPAFHSIAGIGVTAKSARDHVLAGGITQTEADGLDVVPITERLYREVRDQGYHGQAVEWSDGYRGTLDLSQD